MTEERADYLRRCRKGLLEHARASRRLMSAAEWEDMALASEAGLAVGSDQVTAIVHIVWGIGGRPLVD